jgi:hypothetical protein
MLTQTNPPNMFRSIEKLQHYKGVYDAAKQTAIVRKKLRKTAFNKCVVAEYKADLIEFAFDNHPWITYTRGMTKNNSLFDPTYTVKATDAPWWWCRKAYNNPWIGLSCDLLETKLATQETLVNELDDALSKVDRAYERSKSRRESAKRHKLRAAGNIRIEYAKICKRIKKIAISSIQINHIYMAT